MDIRKTMKILYVEDDDNLLDSLGRFLKRIFGKVFLASTAEEALEILKYETPDIAIVDILLPGMSGMDLIKTVKENGPGCKFLITSSVSDMDSLLSAIDLSVENYIVKPVHAEELDEKLFRVAQTIKDEWDREGRKKIFNIDNKKTQEETIRIEMLKLLKKKCGRGPRDIQVFISVDNISIICYGVFSAFEKTLLTNRKNIGHIEEGRRLLYDVIAPDLTELVESTTGVKTELRKVIISSEKDRESILLSCY